MKIAPFLTLLICISGLNIFAQSNLTKEEYAVYATVLKDIYAQDWKNNKTETSFVILDTTYQREYISEWKADKIRGLLKNFKQRNQFPTKLDKSFPIKYQYELTNKSDIDKLLEIGEQEFQKVEDERNKRGIYSVNYAYEIWKCFYEKYPKTNGYHQLSNIGFSTGKEFAVLYVENIAAESDSWHCYILRKKKGRWTIYFSYGAISMS